MDLALEGESCHFVCLGTDVTSIPSLDRDIPSFTSCRKSGREEEEWVLKSGRSRAKENPSSLREGHLAALEK